MPSNPLRSQDLRIHNQKMILARIYENRHCGISQSELVQDTGLKAPTILRIFSALEKQGLIEVLTTPESRNGDADQDDILVRKGRRPVAYTTKKDALYTIGVEFWISYISIGIFDFQGTRVFSRVEPLRKNIDIVETIDCIVKQVGEALSSLNISLEKVPGIGVAAPGQMDIKNRRVINYSRIKNMEDYPLADILEERLGIKVLLHNNCSAMALSEYRYGGYDHQGSMFTFLLRSGVGGAFVDKWGIYTTSDFKTIEPGHISINYGGPLCYCGTRGCLQAYLMELDSAYETEERLLFSALEQKLASQDKGTEKTIRQAAEYLFVVMKTIMRLLSPRSFLILGNGELVSRRIAEHIKQRWVDEPDSFTTHAPPIFSNICSPLVSQRGASDLVISWYFS
jgi:predicted NBD/HSP70 family sugar kinase